MTRRVEILVWAGTLVAPIAWATQHVLIYGVSEANCGPTGRVPFSAWVAGATAVAAVLVSAGLVSGIAAFRALKDAGVDADPPPGRQWLMAVCVLVICPIFLVLVLLDGTGALILGHCHQG